MEENLNFDPTMANELLVRAIAQDLLYLTDITSDVSLARKVNSEAVRVLAEIKQVLDDPDLDDPDLDDPECFYRIDSIVDIFYQAGISTHRHEECE